MIQRIVTLTVLLACPCLAEAATLKPVNIEQFCLTPGKPATLSWNIESGNLGDTTKVVVRDYADRVVMSPKVTISQKGLLKLPLQLKKGFYELEFLDTNQRFGVISQPIFRGERDPFFAIDSAMSWLVQDDQVREGLVKILARSGIPMSRERLNWAEVNPKNDEWNWDGRRRYETLRQTCRGEGVEVLEMFHNTTNWAGRVGTYPDDLVGTAQAWQQIAKRLGPTWGAMEVWNEPDIKFGDYLPADQYVPLVKTFAYFLQEQGISTPLVGGVFAHYHQKYLDNAARNGLPSLVDAVSFHTYGRAMGMEKLIGRYRQWLIDSDRPNTPLWITECGRPWKRGSERPTVEQDAESALDIIMKGVEAKACGIARHFPFVYPYYEERESNFGMMGKDATPLRSMAAYVQLVTALSGKQYLGDLTCDDNSIQLARVFTDDKETVAVLYTGVPKPDKKVGIDLPVTQITGIDGRPIDLAADGSIPVPDGLVYVCLDRAQIGERLKTNTRAMQLLSHAIQPAPKPVPASPIVLRYQFDPEVASPKTEGYHIVTETPGEVPFTVRVFNLSSRAQRRSLTLSFSQPVDFESDEVQKATVPVTGHVDVRWNVNLSRAFAATGALTATVRTDGTADEHIEIDLIGNPTLEQVLRRYSVHQPLAIGDMNAWRPSISANGRLTLKTINDTGLQMSCQFQGGDRWVYPSFQLAKDVAVGQYSAIVLRARCLPKGAPRLFLWEGDTGVGYLSPVIIPADSKWHTAVVPFEDLAVSGANRPDPNHQLDLDQVRRISIGMNSESDENALEVSDAYFVAK